MVCWGGRLSRRKPTGKGRIGVAYASVSMALEHVSVEPVHGINGCTPEDTMRNMGRIASLGMVGTEAAIMDILQEKQEKSSGV